MLTIVLGAVIVGLLFAVRNCTNETIEARKALRLEEKHSSDLEDDVITLSEQLTPLQVKAKAYDFVFNNVYVKAIFDHFFRVELNERGELEIRGINGLNLMVTAGEDGIPARYKDIEEAMRVAEAKRVPVVLNIDEAKELAAKVKAEDAATETAPEVV